MRETFLAVCFTTNFGVRANSLYADFRGVGSAVSPALGMTEKDMDMDYGYGYGYGYGLWILEYDYTINSVLIRSTEEWNR